VLIRTGWRSGAFRARGGIAITVSASHTKTRRGPARELSPPSTDMKNPRFFPLVTAVFVTALLISNIIAAKLIQVGLLVRRPRQILSR
jgi:hypothetical protein